MNRWLSLAFTLSVIVVTSCGDGGQGSSGGASCSTGAGPVSCDGAACGGDIVGTWRLVTFCGPSCVSSVADVITYGADGTYSLGGTWKYTDQNTVTTTVGTASSGAAYCVKGDILWTQRGTGQGTILTVARRRDCGGASDAGLRPDIGVR